MAAPSGQRRLRGNEPFRCYPHFILRELLPWASRRWNITDDPRRRVIAGSSRGGLVATYLGFVAPSAFGAVISQSGSFWWPEPPATEHEWLTRRFDVSPRLPLRFYLDVGNRETVSFRGDGQDQVSVNRRLRDVLMERGYAVTYSEYAGGHDYINWRRTFADGLLATLEASATSGTG